MAVSGASPTLATIGKSRVTCHPILRPQPTRRRRLTHLSIRSNINGTKQENNGESNPRSVQQEALISLARAVTAATVFTALAATIPSPAMASNWHPRRNLRSIRDSVLEDAARARARQQENASRALAQAKKEQAAAADQAKAQDSLLNQAQRAAKRAYKNLQRTVQGESVYSVGVSGGRPDPATYYSRSPSSAGPEATSLGWWVVGFALMGVAYAKWGDNLKLMWRRGPNREKGRWVRDRSLGGKLVFVPDATDAPSARPSWQDDDGFTTDLASAAAARSGGSLMASSGGAASTSSAGSLANNAVAEDVEPTWWAPPAPVGYVSASRKEDMRKQSKTILRSLQDSKLRGEDYSLSDLITLRSICHEGGGIQIKPSTESGRDAILRAAIRFALQASLRQNPSSDLGGYEPGRFISGLAGDLTVPAKRAITITHGEVAATCRGALIDAEAAYRAGDQNKVLYSLGRMVSTLAAFPLPQGSAESELVGRTIQAQTTLEFRRAVFLAAGSADLSIAPIVAEMMGFDPNQVMEQLKMQISVAAAQAAASAVGGQGTDSSSTGDSQE